MAAIPKLLKCYDCDQTFTREEVFGAMEDLVPGYCQHRSVASHTGTDNMKFPFCLEIETALGTEQSPEEVSVYEADKILKFPILFCFRMK